MLRRVAFKKAIAAGALGAAAWEAAARALAASGVPVLDLVWLLGTMLLDRAPVWIWWPLGIIMHAAVGCVWGIFYAYFFWSVYNWKPATQGVVFSLVPAALAGLEMVPQLGWMHPQVVGGQIAHPGLFAFEFGWGGPLMIIVGHLLYGGVMGSVYTRPVGRPAEQIAFTFSRGGRSTSPRRPGTAGPSDRTSASRFMFATGIECSYPTIENGRWRIDQMEEAGHYRHWRRDLELVRELGLRYLRYGPPLHYMWLRPGQYDWSFTDEVVPAMRQLGITPIMDLCHFGVPTWVGNFQNPDFPALFAEYAGAFARRYSDVRLFTPINEMFVTARNSALDGIWNEQLRSERGFTMAVKHLAKASALAAESILREQSEAVFVNSESGEFFQACCPDDEIVRIADFENGRRFIALDLLYGVGTGETVHRYLLENGLTEEEYQWFMQGGPRIARRSILGIDYYEWNEKLITSSGRAESLGELFGWYVITNQYYDRYKRPLMHTETNSQDAQTAPDWLWRQWHNVQLMRRTGVPVVGFTWYSLVDQVDWNIGLAKPLGNVNPVGLYDFNGDPRPVAESYRRLVQMFQDEPLLLATDDDPEMRIVEERLAS